MIEELIFKWAENTPDKPALIHNGIPISYKSLSDLIKLAKGYFSRRGYHGPGYVALYQYNLSDFWILSLALRSLGFTTISVPNKAWFSRPSLPSIRYVFTTEGDNQNGLNDCCAQLGVPVISVSLANEPVNSIDDSIEKYSHGGHILLTSGTTGTYKMVLMTPEMDKVFLQRKVDLTGMGQDSVLCVFGCGGWTGVGYRWAASPWLVGGTTVIQQSHNPHRVFSDHNLTHAVLIPSALATILAAPKNAFACNDKLHLFVGGGAMTRAQVGEIKSRITPNLYNWLASTEAGCIAVTPIETPDDHRWHKLVADRIVEIVDDDNNPVPNGTMGRIRIGAEGGPNGYLNDETTSREFFQNGYFYPGDMAAMRHDSRVSLYGRITDVINMGGQKVLPFPIEDRLCDELGVDGVCIFSKQNSSGEEDVYVVIESEPPIENNQKLPLIKRALSGFPRAYVYYVKKLPRNDFGKILRQQVRAEFETNILSS